MCDGVSGLNRGDHDYGPNGCPFYFGASACTSNYDCANDDPAFLTFGNLASAQGSLGVFWSQYATLQQNIADTPITLELRLVAGCV